MRPAEPKPPTVTTHAVAALLAAGDPAKDLERPVDGVTRIHVPGKPRPKVDRPVRKPASVVAPFEYSTLPINVLWGIILWQQFPTLNTWVGAGITIASGLYLLYANRTPAAARAATD
jgi:hypothetical protein